MVLFPFRKAPPPDEAREAQEDCVLDALRSVYAVVTFGVDGCILGGNARFFETVGYRPDELVGRHHRLLVDPAEADSAAYAQFWADLRAGQPKSAEFKRIHKSGASIWMRAAYSPVRDGAGEVEYVLKTALDITKERQALDRAQAVVEMSIDGQVLDANPAFLEMVGYTLDELRGEHHRALVSPAFAASAEYGAHWRRLAAGEYVSGTFERLGKGGRRIVMRATYNPIFDHDGRPMKVVKYATDVTRFEELVSEVDGLASSLEGQATSMVAAAGQLESGAEDTATRADRAKAATQEVSGVLQSVSAATEELSSSIREIAQHTATAADRARSGRTATKVATDSVDHLERSSGEIEDVVRLIESIADQTKLLALNATIEAARAGDAGKGFGVVANEVSELARQTLAATAKIGAQVDDILGVSGRTAKAVRELGQVIEDMAESQETVAASAEEQRATTDEIARHAAGVASSTAEVAEDASGLLDCAEQGRSLSRGAVDSAKALLDITQQLVSRTREAFQRR